MLSILKTKIEIALTVLIALQGHALYQKTSDGTFVPISAMVDERMIMTMMQANNMNVPTGAINPAEMQQLLAMIPKEGMDELGVAIPTDLSNFKLNKQQAIALISSLPD